MSVESPRAIFSGNPASQLREPALAGESDFNFERLLTE